MRRKLLHFQWSRGAAEGLVCGGLMVVLSCAMNLFPDSTLAAVLLRDVLMIFALGFLFPLYSVLIREKQGLSGLGVRRAKWKRSLLINGILASVLWVVFSQSSTSSVCFTRESFYAVTYIFTAGIFEMLFIYGFLRDRFERAFGVIPAILLTAAFYSLHHAGFQPEFAKLFFVGILYTGVFYLTKNLLVIFPFFWGVGAVWDVLVNSQAGAGIMNQNSFLVAICLLTGMVFSSLLFYRVYNRRCIR